MSLPRLPDRPKLPALPALRVRGSDAATPPDPISVPEDDTPDEYGLGPWAKEVADRGRYYIGIAYKDLHVDGMFPPAYHFGPGQLTIPELILYGWLVDHGYEPNEWSARGFTYQVQELGGRALGGAVVDFEVHRQGRVIGILVHSIYHSLSSPFGGGVANTVNKVQMQRLQASGRFDAVMEVNGNGELEFGGDTAIDNDLRRVDVA